MLKVFRNNNEEVYPLNGIYKVYELETYRLEYTADAPIVDSIVYIEDIALDSSIFNISKLKIVTKNPECLFVDCFGFASLKINNEIYNFNILIEKLKKDDAEDMLMYLWRKDKKIYDIFLSKSSITASDLQESEINMTSKLINYANFFYEKMLEYCMSFESLPFYLLRPQNELSKYSANLIDSDSISWVLENLDEITFSPELRYDPDAIELNGSYGIIDRIFVNKQKQCYNVYENNVILGGFLRVINKLNSLKKEINNNIEVTKRYSEDNYVDFRDLKKIPYVKLLQDVDRVRYKLENLYQKYRKIFSDAVPKIERPILTPVFIGRSHYANAFRLIQRIWGVNFDFQGDMLLFNIQKMSHLYEIYNFYLLIECIDNEVRKLGFDSLYQNEDSNAKYIRTYKRNKLTINFYYEPTYYSEKHFSLDLIRINGERGTYYKPDFLLEFVYSDKDKVYCILDAKYSQLSTVKKRLNDCIYKYILNTGILNYSHKKIDYLFVLAPIDKRIDCVSSDFYFPFIGIIPSKPSNVFDVENMISTIIRRSFNMIDLS